MKAGSSLLQLIVVGAVISLAYADYNELCVRFASGVQFRQPGNCQAYVTCQDGVGTVTSCPDNMFYNKETQQCVATLSDTYCDDQCKSKLGAWVADKANCIGYYYCGSDGAIAGYCPDGYHFNEKSQMCIFPSDSDCSGLSDMCGILANNIKYSDPDNCDQYYHCVKDVLKNPSCSTGQYFDVKTSDCISKYAVSCVAHPLPKNVCGTDSKPISLKFVADDASCRGYYYCAYMGAKVSDKDPVWNQCPEGLFFDLSSQSCKDPTVISCTHNRCDGRGDLLVVSEVWGCRSYYACKNGLVLEERKCPKDMFFDEYRQACTFDETSYPVCDYALK